MPTTVLLNPHARTERAGLLLPQLQQQLAAYPNVSLISTQTVPEALEKLASLAIGSRLVLVGGDGTLHRMLPLILERSLEVGIVGYGSGNDSARAIGLRYVGWQQQLDLALTGHALPFDIGYAQATHPDDPRVVRQLPFISSFSVGFDANVGYRATLGPSRSSGLMRYFVAAVQEWRNLQYWPLSVACDGQEIYSGPTLMAASLNTPTYGGGMPMVPSARYDDGKLNLMLAQNLSAGATIAGLITLAFGRRRMKRREFSTHTYKTLTINSKEVFPIGADGEFLGHTRELSIAIQPGGLQVVRNPSIRP